MHIDRLRICFQLMDADLQYLYSTLRNRADAEISIYQTGCCRKGNNDRKKNLRRSWRDQSIDIDPWSKEIDEKVFKISSDREYREYLKRTRKV